MKREDRGIYVCEAFNGVGTVERRPVDVNIEFAPVPLLSNASGYHTDRSGGLQCAFEAYPQPDIYWIKDGAEIAHNDITTADGFKVITLQSGNDVTVSTLLGQSSWRSVDRDGLYECRAENVRGANYVDFYRPSGIALIDGAHALGASAVTLAFSTAILCALVV